jgi:hypothetical protein
LIRVSFGKEICTTYKIGTLVFFFLFNIAQIFIHLNRISRWDGASKGGPVTKPKSWLDSVTSNSAGASGLGVSSSVPILALPPPGGIKDNPQAIRDAAFAMNATINMSNTTELQQQSYVLQMQINESTRMLARPDLGKFFLVNLNQN